MLVGIDKSFKVGDYITLGAHSGTVTEIGFLTTKLINDEGKKVYIPNQTIFNAPFYNITASPQRKIIFDFDIPASQDIQKAKECILEVIKNMDKADRLESADVIFTSLKQGTFNIQVKFWIAIGSNVADTKSDALVRIKEKLDQENILLSTPMSISIEKES